VQHRAGDNPAAGRQKVQSTPLAPCPIVRGSMPMHSATKPTKHAITVAAVAIAARNGTWGKHGRLPEQADQEPATFAAPGNSAGVDLGMLRDDRSH